MRIYDHEVYTSQSGLLYGEDKAMNISICRLQGFRQRTYTANYYIHMKSQNQTPLPQQCAMMDQTSYPLFPLSYEQPSENPFNHNVQKHLDSVLAD